MYHRKFINDIFKIVDEVKGNRRHVFTESW